MNKTLLSSEPVPMRILVAEDEALVAEDLRDTLENLGYSVVAVVDNAVEAIEQANELLPNIALLDIHLRGELTGVDVARHFRSKLDIPIIFVTAHSDSKTLDWAGSTEPFGYIVKPFDEHELRATIAMAILRHRAEKRARDMEAWLTTTLKSIGDAVIATDAAGHISFLNTTAELLTEWTRLDAIGHPLEDVFVIYKEGQPDLLENLFERVSQSGVIFHLTQGYELRTKSGKMVPIDDSIAPIRDDQDEITGVVVIFRDRSEVKRSLEERRAIELKMQEAQRLESLGVLAGGIAHDFNNLLATILMSASIAIEHAKPAGELQDCLDQIITASEQAASLCKQMLAYAGKGRFVKSVTDLNTLVESTLRLLRVTASRSSVFVLDLSKDIVPIDGDVSQLQQIVMNLVMNASEALPEGRGTITVRTRQRRVDAAELSTARIGGDLAPGEYAILEVVDNGCGMPEDVLDRVFDPFFTTKFQGRGLGLAAVLGILRSHGAALQVISSPAEGTEFRVMFPLADRPILAAPANGRDVSWSKIGGKILVVDDDEALLSLICMMIRRLGFEPVAASDGLEALKTFAASPPGEFCLIIMDLTMPQLGGIDAWTEIRKLHPGQHVLLTSGYSADESLDLFGTHGIRAFVQKPFTLDVFTAAIRKALA